MKKSLRQQFQLTKRQKAKKPLDTNLFRSKMTSMLLGIFFICVGTAQGQEKWEWNTSPTSITKHLGQQTVTDSQGNVYVAGVFTGGIDFGDGITLDASLPTAQDAFIVKYTPQGTPVWAEGITGVGMEQVTGMAINSGDILYVTGYFSGTTNFGGISLTAKGAEDIFLGKYATVMQAGGKQLQDVKSFGGTMQDRAYAITIDRKDQVYITGLFAGTEADFGGTPDERLNSNGSTDFFVAKYNENLNFVWVDGNGGISVDVGLGIATHQDSEGAISVYVTVLFTNSFLGAGNRRVLVRYTEDKVFKWQFPIGEENGFILSPVLYEPLSDMTTDQEGDVYITGSFRKNGINFGNGKSINTKGGSDVFVAKYAGGTGTCVWIKGYGGTTLDEGNGIALDQENNLVVTGKFQGENIDFGGQKISSASKGASDSFLLKLDKNGNTVWADAAGGSNTEVAADVAVDPFNNVYQTGFKGSNQLFTLKYNFANQEINVTGNQKDIVNQSNTVSGENHTDFGEVTLVPGKTLRRSFTIQNRHVGTANLTVKNIKIAGVDNKQFYIEGVPMGDQVVQPNESLEFQVVFEPESPGEKNARVEITTNDSDENPYTFMIRGTAIEPVPDINIRAKDTYSFLFGEVIVNTTKSQEYTIENKGEGDLNISKITLLEGTAVSADFGVATPPANTIGPGKTSTVTIEFTPTAIDDTQKEVSLVIESNDPDQNPLRVQLTGRGIPAPDIHVTGRGESIASGDVTPNVKDGTDFGLIATSTTESRTFIIENLETDSRLTIQAINVTGADKEQFIVDLDNISTSLEAGESTSFVVRFKPVSLGVKTATIEIDNNDPDENPYVFTVRGNTSSSVPELDIEEVMHTGTVDFEEVNVSLGESLEKAFTVKNAGHSTLNITGVEISGDDKGNFEITQALPTSLASREVTEFRVRFTPAEVNKEYTALLSIESNDPNENPYEIFLKGTGIDSRPVINITEVKNGESMDFGTVNIGRSLRQTVTVENTGDLPLEITDFIISANSAFEVIQDLQTIEAGKSTSFTIVFIPSGVGVFTSEIEIKSNDPTTGNYKFTIQGTGVNTISVIRIKEAAEGETVDFGEAYVGKNLEQTFTLENTGDTEAVLDDLVITGEQAGSFEIIQKPSETIQAGETASFTVRFTAEAIGAAEASLQLRQKGLEDNPYIITLKAEGLDISTAIESDWTSQIRLYPNETQGWVNLDIPVNNIPQMTISVYNTKGQKIGTHTCSSMVSGLDLSALTEGVYQLQIRLGKQQIIKSLVIRK